MENPINEEPIKIYIKTKKEEPVKRTLREGTTKTLGTVDSLYDPVENGVRAILQKDKEKEESKGPERKVDEVHVLEKVIQKTNEVIKAVADNLVHLVENKNVSKLEVEFNIAFGQKLDIWLFEVGSEQSIKFNITLENSSKND